MSPPRDAASLIWPGEHRHHSIVRGVVRHVLHSDVKTARAATRAANDRRRFANTWRTGMTWAESTGRERRGEMDARFDL
jgi:hypothetical protein